MTRVIGLDVGTKTIGIAISDPSRRLAQPVVTLSRKSVAKDTETIMKLIMEYKASCCVVGMPYELDGSEARSARLARQIGEAVGEHGIEIIYQDERYTSVDAERRLIAARASRAKRKKIIDQAAAMLILQSFLDHGDWTQDSSK